jgi:hypothetical protein
VALIYVEFITPRPGVSIQEFQKVAGRQQAAWAKRFESDRLLLNLARTWRIGPKPGYMTVWYRPDADLEQLDAWERVFAAGDVDDIEDPINLVIRIEAAGCYRPLLPPTPGSGGPYYVEFFDAVDGEPPAAVERVFRERIDRHENLVLNLVARRIGHLGPDPRYFAVWSAPSYAALAAIAEELDGGELPIRLVEAGLYSELGKEIL